MEEKRIIEVDDGQRRLIIGTLNEKRNELVQQGRDTDFVDNTLLAAIDASTKRAKRREGRDER